MSDDAKSVMFHFERTMSALIQQAIQLGQTTENNPLVKLIIKIRDSLREEIRRKYGYKGLF